MRDAEYAKTLERLADWATSWDAEAAFRLASDLFGMTDAMARIEAEKDEPEDAADRGGPDKGDGTGRRHGGTAGRAEKGSGAEDEEPARGKGKAKEKEPAAAEPPSAAPAKKKNAKKRSYKPKECVSCGKIFTPYYAAQKACGECMEKGKGAKKDKAGRKPALQDAAGGTEEKQSGGIRIPLPKGKPLRISDPEYRRKMAEDLANGVRE